MNLSLKGTLGKLWIPEKDDPGLRLSISERKEEKGREKAGKKRGGNGEGWGGERRTEKRGRHKEGNEISEEREGRIIMESWQNLKEITCQDVILSSAA